MITNLRMGEGKSRGCFVQTNLDYLFESAMGWVQGDDEKIFFTRRRRARREKALITNRCELCASA